jgi:hypothetical protein
VLRLKGSYWSDEESKQRERCGIWRLYDDSGSSTVMWFAGRIRIALY